jgi:hypothetical protein
MNSIGTTTISLYTNVPITNKKNPRSCHGWKDSYFSPNDTPQTTTVRKVSIVAL